MRLSEISFAGGLTLARDVPAADMSGIPLLRAGTVITEAYQRSLAHMGVGSVWVDDALGAGIEPAELVPPEVRRRAAAGVRAGMDRAAHSIDAERTMCHAAVAELEGVVKELALAVESNPGAALVLSD